MFNVRLGSPLRSHCKPDTKVPIQHRLREQDICSGHQAIVEETVELVQRALLRRTVGVTIQERVAMRVQPEDSQCQGWWRHDLKIGRGPEERHKEIVQSDAL